jgi:hypothetical protein
MGNSPWGMGCFIFLTTKVPPLNFQNTAWCPVFWFVEAMDVEGCYVLVDCRFFGPFLEVILIDMLEIFQWDLLVVGM